MIVTMIMKKIINTFFQLNNATTWLGDASEDLLSEDDPQMGCEWDNNRNNNDYYNDDPEIRCEDHKNLIIHQHSHHRRHYHCRHNHNHRYNHRHDHCDDCQMRLQ